MKLTFLGHSAAKLQLPQSTVLIDPYLSGNPLFESSGLTVEDVAADVTHILLTHGHEDHVGDTVALAKQTGARVVCMVELGYLLQKEGVETLSMHNLGGAYEGPDFTCTFVRADHSSSWQGNYAGVAAGLVLTGKFPTFYHMGDTDIFSDMALINEIYHPQVGLVPIGGHFTMNPATAAQAVTRYFNFKKIVPVHYQTFPLLAQSADEFTNAVGKGKVHALQAGESLAL